MVGQTKRLSCTLSSPIHRQRCLIYVAHRLDFGPTYAEVKVAYNNVAKWAKPQGIPFSINWFAMNPQVTAEPKGAVLIISPFNFPIFLLLTPLVSVCMLASQIASWRRAALKLSLMISEYYIDDDSSTCRSALSLPVMPLS